MPGTWALIPIKAKQSAKTRLSGCLSPAQRDALRYAMLEDQLDGLMHCTRLNGITLYGPDPETAAVARRRGLCFLEQPQDVVGLNASVADGVSCLAGKGADIIAVLPGDLPVLAGAELDFAVSAVQAQRHCAVVPNLGFDGTNCLVFPAATPPVFRFGPGSFSFHMSDIPPAARRQAYALPGLAQDIDTPADLMRLCRGPATAGGHRTRALAQAIGLDVPRLFGKEPQQ